MKAIFVVLLSIALFVGISWFVTTEMRPSENPFLINFPTKKNITHEDYIVLQEMLNKKDIDSLLKEMYGRHTGLKAYEEFEKRCWKGIKQILIDPKNHLYPIQKLVKIGKGGNRCIVNCSPFNGKYPSLIDSIPAALEAKGFNGYFYYRLGGYPNPTGKELRYIATPYCFKIFTMLEAQNLGFTNVLWIDSSMLPLRNPEPLFDQIEKNSCFLMDYVDHHWDKLRIFPETRDLLLKLTGTDVWNTRHISTQVFGLKMDAEKTQKLIKYYYKMLELGTPFLSCFPEEYVFVAHFQQSPQEWPSDNMFKTMHFYINESNAVAEIDKFTKNGLYFYLRPH